MGRKLTWFVALWFDGVSAIGLLAFIMHAVLPR